MDHFHVAGIGCTAVKHLSSDVRATHFLGKVCVLNGVEPGSLFVREEKIPQPLRTCLRLQTLQNLRLARRKLPRRSNLYLSLVLSLKRNDLFVKKIAHTF